jgi:hypothetical protein
MITPLHFRLLQSRFLCTSPNPRFHTLCVIRHKNAQPRIWRTLYIFLNDGLCARRNVMNFTLE